MPRDAWAPTRSRHASRRGTAMDLADLESERLIRAADLILLRSQTPPAKPDTTQPIACPACRSTANSVSRQFFRDGTSHLRCECRRCGRFLKYLSKPEGHRTAKRVGPQASKPEPRPGKVSTPASATSRPCNTENTGSLRDTRCSELTVLSELHGQSTTEGSQPGTTDPSTNQRRPQRPRKGQEPRPNSA